MDSWLLGLRLLLLLTAANTAPIVAKGLLGAHGNTPIDFGRRFLDGRPWLGPSKTWRGLACAMLAGGLLAPVLDFPAESGVAAGLLAMAGDALSSFVKRRLAIPSSGQAFVIDQLPESLLPLVVLQPPLGLPWGVVAGVTLAFVLLETPVAWLAHRIGLRDQPY